MTAPSFRLAYVPGVTPTKWVRIWNERLPRVALELIGVPAAEAAELVRAGAADAALLRLPFDRTGLHAISLYTETTVVVVPKDHLVTAAEEVTAADLTDDVVLRPLDDTLDWEQLPGHPFPVRPETTALAIEQVAAGNGLLVVPQSLARLHHRKDLTYRPITDAPESSVVLSWPEGEPTELMEQFIGIVRGRTVNSSRQTPTPPKAKQEKKAAPAARKPQRPQQRGSRRRS
ncbi:LysR family substrate-binding domain-containing protein [Kribbella sp. CA-293567]|uniref:LysR family substrate-binding domain-containing protein n=1 Tax=Kribbella sp. CA-293567 TaxID=3002436 RepID=UPI0022DDBF8B|nr:LysR family substrate-binding domain-containing protein [Kribbella sp. CA-293567]WBQ08150.1 LysR family substrate-binding domain-containing protein [Kribbella sp. CA-293567]